MAMSRKALASLGCATNNRVARIGMRFDEVVTTAFTSVGDRDSIRGTPEASALRLTARRRMQFRTAHKKWAHDVSHT